MYLKKMQNNPNIKAHRLRYCILQQINLKTFTACNDDITGSAVALHCSKAHSEINRKMEKSTPL